MLDKLRALSKRLLRIMAPGKWIALIIAIALLWKPVSFYFIIYDILHPNWEEVTLITSYNTHGTYTEYTEDNGRDLAIQALSHIWLGPPWALNLVAVYHHGGSSSTMTVVEIHTPDGIDRICFHETGSTKGFVRGAGEIYPYFFADENYRKMMSSPDLERTREVRPEDSLEHEYWEPVYR